MQRKNPEVRTVQMRLTPEQFKEFKTILLDLDMTCNEFLFQAIENYKQSKVTNNG